MNAERAAVVAELRARVTKKLSSAVEDRDCVALCIAACLPRDREELFGVLLNNNLCKTATGCADELAVTDAEWKALFGRESRTATEAHAAAVLREKGFGSHAVAISSALRCSLTEPEYAASWQRATSKVSCYVALYTDSSEEFIAHVLGGLVRADTRRLDEVRCTAEDEETDQLLLCKGVLALALSVL